MTSIQQKGLSSERVWASPSINFDDLECSICRDLLWKPVACQTCETSFCSSCIQQWLTNNGTTCPNRCETYTERKCPPLTVKLLSRLQISCFYQSNGCEQIMSYEALDKHEIECDYQPEPCPGCRLEMYKKDFTIHKETCELIELTCEDCRMMYRRNEASIKHTDDICMKAQINRLKQESKENKCQIEKLYSQLTEIQQLRYLLTRDMITFEDLTSMGNNSTLTVKKYRGLTWKKIFCMHELFAIQQYPKSGYVTSFMPGGSLFVAFFHEEASISTEPSNETFTLFSLTVSAAWHDNLELTMTAYRNAVQVYHHDVIPLFGRPQRILLQWKNIDKVMFRPVGGTPHSGSGERQGAYVVLTQLVIDNLGETKTNLSIN